MYSEQVFLIQTKMCGWWKDDLHVVHSVYFSSQADRPDKRSLVDPLRHTPPYPVPWKDYSVTVSHHLSSKEHP